MRIPKLKNYNTIAVLLFTLFYLTSCTRTTITQIGKVNMVSNRNVNASFEYQPIKSYAGLSDRELKRSNSKTIEEAIDKTVKSVPGGEFVMNAKIFLINSEYFAVEGDIWGNTVKEYQGFKQGTKVQWKSGFKTKIGIITALVNDEKCTVEEEGTSSFFSIRYNDLMKIGE